MQQVNIQITTNNREATSLTATGL